MHPCGLQTQVWVRTSASRCCTWVVVLGLDVVLAELVVLVVVVSVVLVIVRWAAVPRRIVCDRHSSQTAPSRSHRDQCVVHWASMVHHVHAVSYACCNLRRLADRCNSPSRTMSPSTDRASASGAIVGTAPVAMLFGTMPAPLPPVQYVDAIMLVVSDLPAVEALITFEGFLPAIYAQAVACTLEPTPL
jgi:hypothetical protein